MNEKQTVEQTAPVPVTSKDTEQAPVVHEQVRLARDISRRYAKVFAALAK
jgi:hypothetical protein